MTKYKVAVIVAEVHSVALAIAEIFAVGTLACLHPRPVTVWLIAVLPHIDEVVLIYISLGKVASDAGAGGNRSVYHD